MCSQPFSDASSNDEELLARASTGDDCALAEILNRNRQRLKRMVRTRLDWRLHGRFDPSDVIQDVYLDAARRLPEYVKSPTIPFFLWLRSLTAQRLIDLHRQHLGAKMRDAGQEVHLPYGAYPPASSLSLVSQLIGSTSTPARKAIRAELQAQVQEALQSLDALDREVLTLRHFEMLTNNEVAEVLGIQKTAASNRYIRAIKRLSAVLEGKGFP